MRPQPSGSASPWTVLRSHYRGFEQAAELARKIDRDACMHGSLLVKKALGAAQPKHPFVPDVGMNVEALAAIEAEADESLRGHIIAGPRQRYVERFPIQRK